MNDTVKFFLAAHKLQKKYIFINMSSYMDITWYTSFIKKNLNIDFYDKYTFLVSTRNINDLQIYDYVPYDFINLHTPIIYFVDSFYSLKNNALWYKMRNSEKDIIIDINGAICTIGDLLNNNY